MLTLNGKTSVPSYFWVIMSFTMVFKFFVCRLNAGCWANCVQSRFKVFAEFTSWRTIGRFCMQFKLLVKASKVWESGSMVFPEKERGND